MKKTLIIVLILSLLVFAGCQKEEEEKTDSKLKVVATTTMLYDLAKQIGGENIDLVGLMGPGVDPHLYQPTAGNVNSVKEADFFIYNGLYLEVNFVDIAKNVKDNNKVLFTAGDFVKKDDLIENFEGGEHPDPHVWFNVRIWKDIATGLKDSLIEADAKNKESYEKNYKEYSAKLDELDEYIKSRIEEVQKESRVLVTAHDAFNYFGKAYDFEVTGLQGISTETEVGTADVKKLADFIVERKIKAIFVESSVPQKSIEAVQEAVKAKNFDVSIGGELYSDSLGNTGEEEGTYIGALKSNIDTIINALK